MRLTHDGEIFICQCQFEYRDTPRKAGFRWDPNARIWYTDKLGVAHQLVRYADEKAKNQLSRTLITQADWLGAVPYPQHLMPKKFQNEVAAPFALSRNRSYLALDPGLGKTICAALIWNALRAPTVYVCPPFMLGNVEEELTKWCIGSPNIRRITGNCADADIVLVPDSILARDKTIAQVRGGMEYVRERKMKPLLIVDEAHRFKTDTSERTKALFKTYVPLFDRVVFLSGTPMPNRPMELYPLLSHCAPALIDYANKFEYGVKYCAGWESQWGWDFSGASNVEELAKRVIGPFMLRLKKEDVLPELPPKMEELIFIDESMPPELREMDRTILKNTSPTDLMKHVIGEEHLASYRRLLGVAKVKPAADYLRFLLEQGDESILVFAIHREVIAELTKKLAAYDPLVITGSVEKDERFKIAKEFQTNPKRRVLILNIQAGGVGFNLTKATRVVFVEFSWTPAENDQAIDRAHRIGQDQRVLAQYMVHRNSIDRAVMETNFRKKEATQHL